MLEGKIAFQPPKTILHGQKKTLGILAHLLRMVMEPKSGQNGWGEHKGVLAHEALQSSYRVGRVRTKALGFVEPCCLRGGFVTIAVENKPVSS